MWSHVFSTAYKKRIKWKKVRKESGERWNYRLVNSSKLHTVQIHNVVYWEKGLLLRFLCCLNKMKGRYQKIICLVIRVSPVKYIYIHSLLCYGDDDAYYPQVVRRIRIYFFYSYRSGMLVLRHGNVFFI